MPPYCRRCPCRWICGGGYGGRRDGAIQTIRDGGMPIEEQPMNWKDMVPAPYDKKAVDAYTRTRIILMNGIENNAVLMSHAIERMHPDPPGVKKSMA